MMGAAGTAVFTRRGSSACLYLTVALGILFASLPGWAEEKEKEDPFGKKYTLLGTGRRDPFTIWKENVITPPMDIKEDDFVVMLPTPPKQGPTVTTAPSENITRIVDEAYKDLYSGRYVNCIKRCDDALNKMDDPGVQQQGLLQERCLRIQTAAKKLKSRKDVEQKFADLPIRIEGIVWRPKAAFAVIDGRVRQVGEIVKGARIYKINSYDVVFMYEGFKVSKKLFEGGKQDGAKAARGKR